MANTLPTMDTIGFVSDPRVKAERCLANYLSTNFSQSTLFLGKLTSLIYAIKSNPNNLANLGQRVTADLTKVYGAYLDNVTVEASTVPVTDAKGVQSGAVYELRIRITFSNNGVTEELAKTLLVENQAVKRIADLEVR